MTPIRVLVVDDSVVIRKLLSDTLSGDRALEAVGTARDGRIALAKIALLKPDLVTLDVEMPVMNGLVSGIYKAEEKLYLLADGCGRRMKQLGARSPREYWDQLTAQPSRDGELRQLLNEITIGETCLFRSQPQIDALRKVILPEIVTGKTKQITKRLRIWSAGCSTGEESYTLAMNMMEESERLLKGWTRRNYRY